MGLDMYLLKTSKEKVEGVLGCMNGFFPMGIKTDKIQIGYWRKAYSVMDKICQVLNVYYNDVNCVELEMSIDNINEMLNEAESRIKNKQYKNEWDKIDWEEALEIFKNAKKIKEEENADIFFTCWY